MSKALTEARPLDASAALVLDDEPLIALDFASALNDLGFATVEIASDLLKAEAIFKEYRPAFALLDVSLGGGVDSVGFGKFLASQGVQVFFSSGYSLEDLHPDVSEFPFIEKPSSGESLRDLLKPGKR